MPLALQALTAFVATLALVVAMRPAALRWGWVDSPSERKHHRGQVPLVGGVAIFTVFLSLWVLFHGSHPWNPQLLLCCTVLVAFGAADDHFELSHHMRLAVQVAIALLMAAGANIVLIDLGRILPGIGILELGWLALPVTVFAVTGGINAANMVDGIDGLGAGLALIALVAIAFIAGPQHEIFPLPLLLAAATCAFFLLNLRASRQSRFSVFLGDAGSMTLGFVISFAMIALSQGEGRAMEPVVALWIFCLPLTDAMTLCIRRLLHRRSPFSPDRTHIHHLLLSLGLNASQTLCLLLLLAAGAAVIGIMASYFGVAEWVSFALFLALWALYGRFSFTYWKKQAPAR